MKRDDLFTTLHDQYNTFSYTLQDPEAFHHDVYEISRDADTVDEFHRMMADRRQMRLRELNESLETLAVEIIANPKLMATEQWTHALQLFRTKSFDSIVRYFASYIPDDYLDHHDTHSTSSSSTFSESDTISTAASCVDDVPSPFTDDEFFPNGSVMTSARLKTKLVMSTIFASPYHLRLLKLLSQSRLHHPPHQLQIPTSTRRILLLDLCRFLDLNPDISFPV